MSKNPQGFTKSGGNQEWGRKARKEEDRLRGTNNSARNEAVDTGWDEWEHERAQHEAEALADAEMARWDDDPSPYDGNYSEC